MWFIVNVFCFLDNFQIKVIKTITVQVFIYIYVSIYEHYFPKFSCFYLLENHNALKLFP